MSGHNGAPNPEDYPSFDVVAATVQEALGAHQINLSVSDNPVLLGAAMLIHDLRLPYNNENVLQALIVEPAQAAIRGEASFVNKMLRGYKELADRASGRDGLELRPGEWITYYEQEAMFLNEAARQVERAVVIELRHKVGGRVYEADFTRPTMMIDHPCRRQDGILDTVPEGVTLLLGHQDIRLRT